jgi:hypothetical protein
MKPFEIEFTNDQGALYSRRAFGSGGVEAESSLLVWREPVANRRLAGGDRHTHSAGGHRQHRRRPCQPGQRRSTGPTCSDLPEAMPFGSTQAKADRNLRTSSAP